MAYYRDVAPYLPVGLVPRCYAAVWDDDTSRFSLLLEDLTATHAMISEWPVPPTDEQCRRIVQVYARLHACLWDHPDLGTTIGTFIDAPLTDWFNHVPAALRRIRGSPRRSAVPEASRGSMSARSHAGTGWRTATARARDLTVVHGDAHVWNALHSPDGDIRVDRLGQLASSPRPPMTSRT